MSSLSEMRRHWFRRGHRNQQSQSQAGTSTAPDPQIASLPVPASPSPRVSLPDRTSLPNRASPNPTSRSSSVAPPSVPAPPRDLWLTALESLKGDERKLIDAMKMERPTTPTLSATIDDLISVTMRKQMDCEGRFWRIRIGGNEVVLRDYMAKIIEGLKLAKSIGDIAVQYDPTGHAKLPWEIMGFVLEVVGTESELMSALLEDMEKVSRIVSRCKVYELLYRPETVPADCLENLDDALVKQYAGVLQLIGLTYKQLSRYSVVRGLASKVTHKKHEELIGNLSQQETQVNLEANVCEGRRSGMADARLWNSVQDLHGVLQKIEGPVLQIDLGVRAILRHMRAEERIEILEWISKIPYNKHHDEIVQLRTPNTCEWLIEHATFSRWQDEESSIMLYLRGLPGTGKTFLTSRVIDLVRGSLGNNNQDEAFAFFYCNRIDSARGDALSVLRSLVRQLSTNASDSDHIHPKVQQLYPTTRSNASDLNIPTCKELLIELTNLYPKTTIVLDALDECDLTSRRHLLDILSEILDNATKPVKIFVSSRPDVDITTRLASRPSVEIQAKDNGDDIAKFSNQEISKHPRWEQMQTGLRDDIINTLLAKSDGMFQWAALQIQQLLVLNTEPAIRDRLGVLPVDLKAAYDEIYSKVERLHPHERRLVDNAFKWMIGSCKPLSSAELLPAIAQDPDSDDFIPVGDFDEGLLLQLSSNLLVLDSQRLVWRFAHLSVAEYFESNHWSPQKTHGTIAKVCLVWLLKTHEKEIPNAEIEIEMLDSSDPPLEEQDSLMQPTFWTKQKPLRKHITRFKLERYHWPSPEQPQDSDLDSAGPREESDTSLSEARSPVGPVQAERDYLHPLQFYIRHHWMIHVKAQEDHKAVTDQRLVTLLKAFLGDPFDSSCAYRGWYMDMARATGGRPETLNGHPGGDIPPTSFFKAKRGFFDFDLQPRTNASLAMCLFGFYSTLLDWWDNPAIYERLNDKGESLLAIAARMGHMDICKHIIKAGIAVDQPLGGRYGSALAAAASSGELETVKELLRAGADINLALPGSYGSALAAAAYWGKLEATIQLLNEGADVNLVLQGSFRNALAAALYMGYTAIAKVLIARGADLSGAVESVREAPAYVNRREMLQLLEDNGVDVEEPID